MKMEIRKLSDSEIEVLFEISWDEFLPFYKGAVLKLAENLTVPGFRPGKVPKEIVLKRLGEEKILLKAAESAVNKFYPDGIEKEKIEAIDDPEIQITKLATGNPFCFKAKIKIIPEIILPDYKKISSQFKKNPVAADEKEVEDGLMLLRQSRTKFKELTRGAAAGDIVSISYQSPNIENNRVFEDRFVLGKGGFPESFEKNIEGLKKNEEKSFLADLPQKKEGVVWQKISFKVKVKKAEEMILPEANDKFAKEIGNFESLEDLKNHIKTNILIKKEGEEINRLIEEIMGKLRAETKIDIPFELVEKEKENLFEDLKRRLESNLKMTFPDYLKRTGEDEEKIKDSLQKEAEKRIKNSLLIKEIGKKEGVAASEAEIIEETNRFLKNIGQETGLKLDQKRIRDYYKDIICNKKVLKIITSYVSNSSDHN